MNARKLLLPLALAATVLLLPSAATAAPAKSKLTTHSYDGGFFGYVDGKAPKLCAAGRQIALYEQVGPRRGAMDELVGKTRARKANGGYQWSVRDEGTGEVYAVAAAKPGCAPSASRTLVDLPRGQADPRLCGKSSGPGFCMLTLPGSKMNFSPENCTSFSKGSGDCSGGESSNANWPWSGDYHSVFGEFEWHEIGPGQKRKLLYWTHTNGGSTGMGHLSGTLPGPASAAFSLEDGYAQNGNYGEGPHFMTPDLPGAAPGEQGGPLYLNFEAKDCFLCREHIYIHGWMLRK
jgi:hypothetical protein